MVQVLLGVGLALFALGGLSERGFASDDLLPPWIEAAIVGAAFTLSALPSRWAMAPRALFVLPGFLVFLDVLENREPPMPFLSSFLCSACAAIFVTAYSAYLSEKSRRGD